MTTDPVAELQTLLGDLEVLDRLSVDECRMLVSMITEARHLQAERLDGSLEEALTVLPRALRGTARRMLFS